MCKNNTKKISQLRITCRIVSKFGFFLIVGGLWGLLDMDRWFCGGIGGALLNFRGIGGVLCSSGGAIGGCGSFPRDAVTVTLHRKCQIFNYYFDNICLNYVVDIMLSIHICIIHIEWYSVAKLGTVLLNLRVLIIIVDDIMFTVHNTT